MLVGVGVQAVTFAVAHHWLAIACSSVCAGHGLAHCGGHFSVLCHYDSCRGSGWVRPALISPERAGAGECLCCWP
jgi:hypothetical protein